MQTRSPCRSSYLRAFRTLFGLLLWCVLPTGSYAQTTFDFTGPPVLLSGNALQQGALYRYASVSAGIDALVVINALNMATLVQLDQVDGVNRALQPEIDGDAQGAYVEFEITFVSSGTSTPNAISARFSALDVDSPLEFYTFSDISDYTVESDTELTVSVSDPQTLNIVGGGAGYASTSVGNTSVVASFSVNQLASFTYRVGVNGDVTRQTSLLFEPVNFTSPVFFNINDAPVVNSDTISTGENLSLMVAAEQGVLANDTDIDLGIDTDVLVVDSFTVGVNTYPANNSASLQEGEFTLNSDGSYEFIPAANFSGMVPVIGYQVSDGNGGEGSSTLTLSVTASNSPPVLTDDIALLDTYDTLIISVLDNDIDTDGSLDVSSLRWVADLSPFPAGTTLSADLGSLNVAGEGRWLIAGNSVEFSPLVNSSGNVTPVRYQLDDNNGATAIAEIRLTDGLPPAEAEVTIDEDRDNNGFLGLDEIDGAVNVSAQLSDRMRAGDLLTFVSAGNTEEIFISPEQLQNGLISVAFDPPADGTLFEVIATVTDNAGNRSAETSDQAVIDITANDPPLVNILADSDNNGFISQQEYRDQIQVEVLLPATAAVNDRLTVNAGTTTSEIVITPIHIADGVLSLTLTDPVDGDALSVVAEITDEAGNRSASGSDSVMIDSTAPPAPTVDNLISSSSTPTVSGTLPVDSNYLLSVQVAGVLYATDDGQLVESEGGNWSLTIPATDSLADGVYDVTVVVTDMAGNSSSDTTTNELIIDLIRPEVNAGNLGPSSDSAPLVSGSTDQQDDTQVLVKTDADQIVCTALVSAQQWSCPIQVPLNVGINTLEAVVTDIAGNQGTDVFTVTVVAAIDSDEDGIPDDIEGTEDFDQDGIANYLDLDSDNDSITDRLETLVDRDNDGIRNYLDPDSDNDGISDLQEAHHTAVPGNAGISQLDSAFVVGANGLADILESVTDSGVTTLPHDTDKDNVADFIDHDSDNDGIADVVENGDADIDLDAMRSDGVIIIAADFDNDGVANYRDLDSDQDGITDIREIPWSDNNGDGIVDTLQDVNSDGRADLFNDGVALVRDFDGDGYANFLDLDSDADKKPDIIESGRLDTNKDGMHDSWFDLNGNGVADAVDSAYTGGDDVDGDFIDDLYDSDFNTASDVDADGIIDEYDFDKNGDGLVDSLIEIPLRLPDLNGNGQADVFDPALPVTAALLSTGVGRLGSGCAIANRAEQRSSQKVDLLFYCLLLGAMAGIMRNRQMRVASGAASKAAIKG